MAVSMTTMTTINVPTEQVIELRVRNKLSDTGAVGEALDVLGERFSLASKLVMQLQVAVDEALSNIIKYAWLDTEEHETLIQFTIMPEQIRIELIDDGRPFDPHSVNMNVNIAATSAGCKLSQGGRGIALLKQLVDAVEYQRIDNHNHLVLHKNTSSVQTPPGKHIHG